MFKYNAVWNKISQQRFFPFLAILFLYRDISIYDWDIIETSILKIDITIRNIRIIDRDIPLLEKNDIYLYLNTFKLKWLPLDSNPRSSYHELYLLQANPLRVFKSKVQISQFYIYIYIYIYFSISNE